jgi:hypothetical protein
MLDPGSCVAIADGERPGRSLGIIARLVPPTREVGQIALQSNV